MSNRRRSKSGPRGLEPVVVCTGGDDAHKEQVLGLLCTPDVVKLAKWIQLGTMELHRVDDDAGARWAIEWHCPVPACRRNYELREANYQRVADWLSGQARAAGATRVRFDISKGAKGRATLSP